MTGMLPAACLLALASLYGTGAQLLHETSLSSRLRSKVPLSKDGQENIGSFQELDDSIDGSAEISEQNDVTLQNFLDGDLKTRWKAIAAVGNRYVNRRRSLPMWDNMTQQSVSDHKECFLDSNRRRMMDKDMWPYPEPSDWGTVECGHRRRFTRRRAFAVAPFADIQPFQMDPPSTFVSSLYLESGGRINTLATAEFNRRLQASVNPIVLRVCPTCDAFYKTVYYRRFTFLNNFEAYDYMTCNWNPQMNVAGTDYKIYSTLKDALNDESSWQACTNASAPGVGFPGDCGNQSEFMLRPLGQWSSIPSQNGVCSFKQGGQTNVQFYILEATADILARRPVDPTPDRMLAWFKSESLVPASPLNSTWMSSVNYFTSMSSSQTGTGKNWASPSDVGALTAVQDNNMKGLLPAGIINQGPSPTTNPSLNGASSPLTYISGSATDALRFGPLISKNFSVCALTRYTGTGTSRRILQGSDTNWLLGHYAGSVGVAHFDLWATPASRNQFSTKWLAICGTSQELYTYQGGGMDLSPVAVAQSLQINVGGCPACQGQTSSFGVAEVIVWDKALTDAEVQQAIAYLNWKLEAGTPPTPVWTMPPSSFVTFGDPQTLGFSPQLWFKSEMIGASGSATWPSVTGSRTINSSSATGLSFRSGSIGPNACKRGFGAASCVNYLEGLETSALTLMTSVSGIFTVCSVTRYLDTTTQRTILAGYTNTVLKDGQKYVHGHYNGNVGVAQHNSVWRTASSDRNPGSLHWVVLCGSNGGGGIYEGVIDVSVPTYFPTTGTPVPITLGINLFQGTTGSPVRSKFGLMEFMVWNSRLSDAQMVQVGQYLLWKLQNFNTNR